MKITYYFKVPSLIRSAALGVGVGVVFPAFGQDIGPDYLIGADGKVLRDRAARAGRNPQTGEELKIAASRVPAFKPGAALKALRSMGAESKDWQ